MKARKKSVVIDFFEVTGCEFEDISALVTWVGSFGDIFLNHFNVDNFPQFKVKTLEGISYDFNDKDMIIRGVNGEYYPCKKDIFYKTYDVL